MKIRNLYTLTLMILVTPFAFASGQHAGGHGHHGDPGASAHWMSPAEEAGRVNPVRATASSIAEGKQLFQRNCASCHGENADGQGMAGMMLNPKPANLRVMSGVHPDGDFAWKIRQGRGAMPAWKGSLNEQQIWHLVNFIQDLKNQSDMPGNSESGHGHHDHHGDSAH